MESLEFEVVTIAPAREALKDDRGQNAELARNAAGVQDEPALLMEETLQWMTEMPEQVRPLELARTFPRIANGIAELWRRVARCEEYLDSLIVDQRGDREGFPTAVALELARLRGYYADLHPSGGSAGGLVERGK